MQKTEKGLVVVVPFKWACFISVMFVIFMAFFAGDMVWQIGAGIQSTITMMNTEGEIFFIGTIFLFFASFPIFYWLGDNMLDGIKLAWNGIKFVWASRPHFQPAPAKK